MEEQWLYSKLLPADLSPQPKDEIYSSLLGPEYLESIHFKEPFKRQFLIYVFFLIQDLIANWPLFIQMVQTYNGSDFYP